MSDRSGDRVIKMPGGGSGKFYLFAFLGMLLSGIFERGGFWKGTFRAKNCLSSVFTHVFQVDSLKGRGHPEGTLLGPFFFGFPLRKTTFFILSAPPFGQACQLKLGHALEYLRICHFTCTPGRQISLLGCTLKIVISGGPSGDPTMSLTPPLR